MLLVKRRQRDLELPTVVEQQVGQICAEALELEENLKLKEVADATLFGLRKLVDRVWSSKLSVRGRTDELVRNLKQNIENLGE